jgi:D-arabinose 1-dehydrogenase-like Zn-dependent alcohol dehydrogenase
VPSHLSFEEAATLPCAAVTAWVALTGHRRVIAGDIFLTQGSGGLTTGRRLEISSRLVFGAYGMDAQLGKNYEPYPNDFVCLYSCCS